MCMFKKAMVIAVTLVFICCANANAANINKITKDSKLQTALTILEQTGSEHLVNSLEKNKVQVRFYDLSSISFDYAKHYAMRADTQDGKQYILINNRFENAPVEAIACLVAHESIHNLPNATFAEEVMATTVDATTWIKLRNNVDYQNSNNALVKRLNRNADRYLSSVNGIANSISQNATYRRQFNL